MSGHRRVWPDIHLDELKRINPDPTKDFDMFAAIERAWLICKLPIMQQIELMKNRILFQYGETSLPILLIF